MAQKKHLGAMAAAAGALVAVTLLVLMLAVVNPQPAGAAFPGINGKIAYWGYGVDGNDSEIFAIDPDLGGRQGRQLTANDTEDRYPCYSPDGNRIGYLNKDEMLSDKLFTMPATGGTRDLIVTPNPGKDLHDCSFTGPRGSHIIYSGEDPKPAPPGVGLQHELFTIPADGDGTPTRLTNSNDSEFHPSFTAVGIRVAYSAPGGVPPSSDSEIFTMPVTGGTGGTPTQLTFNDSWDADPDFRPDGRRIVYEGEQPGTGGPGLNDSEIFTIPATGGRRTQLTFNDTRDFSPVYSPDGRQIAYMGLGGVGSGDDWEIFTMPATRGQRVQVSFNNWGDFDPSWGPRPLPALKRLPGNDVSESPGLRSPSK